MIGIMLSYLFVIFLILYSVYLFYFLFGNTIIVLIFTRLMEAEVFDFCPMFFIK